MISEIMNSINNYFINRTQIEKGDFVIEDGIINVKGRYVTGQYIRIVGSILNDGVYLLSDELITLTGAKNEVFRGIVCGLVVPQGFVKLAEDIEKFEKSTDVKKRALSSVSIGSYSESRATGKDGAPLAWQDVFRKELNKYRRMFPEVIT